MSMDSRIVKMAGAMAVIAGMVTSLAWAGGGPGYHGPFGFGRVPSEAEIKARDIAVGPDGEGLPPGRGTVAAGEQVYKAKCVACHGPTGTEGPMDKLVGEKLPVKTIGSFWPYATTVFDYIRRAMPQNAPESLSNDDVYAVSAYILNLNGLLPADATLEAKTLSAIKMPNQSMFVSDPRPEVKTPACMTGC